MAIKIPIVIDDDTNVTAEYWKIKSLQYANNTTIVVDGFFNKESRDNNKKSLSTLSFIINEKILSVSDAYNVLKTFVSFHNSEDC